MGVNFIYYRDRFLYCGRVGSFPFISSIDRRGSGIINTGRAPARHYHCGTTRKAAPQHQGPFKASSDRRGCGIINAGRHQPGTTIAELHARWALNKQSPFKPSSDRQGSGIINAERHRPCTTIAGLHARRALDKQSPFKASSDRRGCGIVNTERHRPGTTRKVGPQQAEPLQGKQWQTGGAASSIRRGTGPCTTIAGATCKATPQQAEAPSMQAATRGGSGIINARRHWPGTTIAGLHARWALNKQSPFEASSDRWGMRHHQCGEAPVRHHHRGTTRKVDPRQAEPLLIDQRQMG